MLKFNEQQQIDDIQGALELRPQVEKIVDEVWGQERLTTMYFIQESAALMLLLCRQ